MAGLIEMLSEKEKWSFLQYLTTKNKKTEAQNIIYVQALYNGEDEKVIKANLYRDNDNAYRALKKRVFDALIDFIANNSFKNEASEDVEAIKYLVASRRLFAHGLYKEGFKILKRAELEAIKIDQFTILSEIYHLYVKHAASKVALYSLEDLLSLIEKNQQKLLIEERFNLANTYLKIAFKDLETGSLEVLLEEAFSKFEIKLKDVFSYRTLYSLGQIISKGAEVTNDYQSAYQFLNQALEETKKNSPYHQRYAEYLSETLFILAKLSFRIRFFDKSKEFIEESIQISNQRKGVKVINQLVLQSLIYNYSQKPREAINLLDEIIGQSKKWSDDLLHANLSLIVFRFQQGEYKEVSKLFTHFFKTEKYYEEKMGVHWTASKSLIEILLHIELGNIDYVSARIESFKRRYKHYLSSLDEGNPMVFLAFIETYLNDPYKITSDAFKEKVERSFAWKNENELDIFQMAFYAWLKAKMEKRNLYEVTLALVNPSGVKNQR